MKNFQIQYDLNGHAHNETVQASNPGHAQAKLLQLYPAAKVLKCTLAGRLAGNIRFPVVWIDYGPVSTARPEPLPDDGVREQATFGFLSKIKGPRRK